MGELPIGQPTGIRSYGQVRQKLKQAMFRHLQSELHRSLKTTPENCAYNHPTSIGRSQERVGICRFDGPLQDGQVSPRGKVCDTGVAGCSAQASACRCWLKLRSKEEIKLEFRNLMVSDRGIIAASYPDVAALMWVLDGVDFAEDIQVVEDEVDNVDQAVGK